MPTQIIKTCEHCSLQFTVVPRYKKKLFCSVNCYRTNKKQNAKNPKHDECLNCRSPLSGKHTKKFCCQSCAATFNNNQRDQSLHQKQRVTLMATLTDQGLAKTNEKEIYQDKCSFKFNIYQYPTIPGFPLLLTYGVYNHHNNKNGIVRDHIMSKEYGWRNNISPHIISHPANCQFITNLDNIKKGTASCISYQELEERIKLWDAQGYVHNIQPCNIKIVNKAKIKTVKRSNPCDYELYKWKLQEKATGKIVEITSISNWLKANKLSTDKIYSANASWTILEKYNLRTGEKII